MPAIAGIPGFEDVTVVTRRIAGMSLTKSAEVLLTASSRAIELAGSVDR